ncbi:MAG: DUF4139 domain-containing protein [Rhodospirillaceae bacterium]|nr:DUF4139 domain-containing protein [Rhodospirillaceae bacterium]
MSIKQLFLSTVATTFLGGMALQAQEQQIGVDTQTHVAVTIYNENLALVRDQRSINFKQGVNDIAFVGVSTRIRPETSLFHVEGGGVGMLEQNFDFDLLTPAKLLEKSVGGKVRFAVWDEALKQEKIVEAEVLSVVGGVVLKIGDRIETQLPGRIIYDQVPANLRANPTLVLKLNSEVVGQKQVELDYLTGGLSWKADYVASLSADETQLNLTGLVTLTNQSGINYTNAQLQLVAGDLNLVRNNMDEVLAPRNLAGSGAQQELQQESLFEYHLYSLSRPTTVAQNQTKQVVMLTGEGVKVNKEYRFGGITNGYTDVMGDREMVNASVRIQFSNTQAFGLGLPLPKGIVRVYKNDSKGQAIFVGEDAIQHTPKGEDVTLTLGNAFDVTARAKQTDFSKIAKNVYESAYEIEFKNAKSEAVEVTLVESVPGDWRVLQQSVAGKKLNAHQMEWKITVPANGKTVFTYRVRVTY